MISAEIASVILDYHSKWSVGIFTSSLTLASFLFTMKSFVIQTVKDKIYDSPSYKDKVKQRRESGSDVEYYGGLKRLSFLLKWTILAALINSMLQLCLSPFENVWLAIICLLASVFTGILFFSVVWIVSENMRDLIEQAEQKAESEEK
ncbi:TPA: hypothetical protein I7203_16255 [Vibrio vulnificus]|uniref:hypothetical protein n=1 Tax=Vibrio parahaemolyticus TaxID=670 RepID=UPI000946FFFE|nr:hypothetical protein [Vibrio parahaemolyticus]HAS6247901.1 hypothetical protein [Vibrio vulnificus]EGR3375921.1 hypothetical protein [Vibrio parahaemolyticus]EIO5099419.1 hypothetical protein [Vibrio parahaemolyticus]MDF4490120.1 hypothetical protein [Vibrio parahaemolyticus]MDF5331515.1 hypothetical protein [Vibrio parahaemolyticus]